MKCGKSPAYITCIPIILTLFLLTFQGIIRAGSNSIDIIPRNDDLIRGNESPTDTHVRSDGYDSILGNSKSTRSRVSKGIPADGSEGDMMIDSDLIIEKGETLEIGAGTVISMARDVNITVRGRFIVKGEKDNRVIFRPMSPDFAWGGLLIDTTGSVHIRNADITGAKRAIISNNSSPILENLTIRKTTSGMIFLGRCAPLVRNVTFIDVTNSVGLQGANEGRTGMVFGNIPWEMELTRGDRIGEYSVNDLSSEKFEKLLDGFTRSDISSLDTVILRKNISLAREEIENRICRGDLRLGLFSREMEIHGSHVIARVNGVLQNGSAIGKWDGEPPDHRAEHLKDQVSEKGGAINDAVNGTGFFNRYSGNLAAMNEFTEADLPLLTNILPTKCDIVLIGGFHEGTNEIEVELAAESLEIGAPSVFLHYATPSRGIFDNITITDGGDWGVYLSGSSPVLSRLRIENVPRHMILKQDSHPFVVDGSFRGNGARSGILSSEKGSSIRILTSSFLDFHHSPIEISQGTITMHSCHFSNMDNRGDEAVFIEPNPFLLPDISQSLEMIPIHIENTIMENISGWGIRMDGGSIHVCDSSFRNCENGIYIGEGTKGNITGNDLRDMTGAGILVYRAINDGFTITSNRLFNIERNGIVIKETRVRIIQNTVERFSDIYEDMEPLTRTDLLSKNWGLFLERSGGYVEGNRFSNNTFSILVGVDSTVIFINNSIVGKEGIGIGILSEKVVRLSDTIVRIDEKYDIVRIEDSEVYFENSQFNTTWYLEDDELSERGLGRAWFPGIIVLPVLILILMGLWGKKK